MKKSWFHRLWFDNVICGKLIKKYKIDKILSLQNTAVPHTDIPQTIYLHLSLPFIEYRFSFFENKLFWIYQNVIGKLIYKSVKRADRVIVQTQWMKSSIISKCNVDGEKITIIPPVVDLKLEKNFDLKFYNNTFFIQQRIIHIKITLLF